MRLRNAFLSLMSGNVLVTAANLVRDVTLAAVFGAALESDVFFLAISIPVFIVTVGSNAFRSVTVPALGQAQAAGPDRFVAFARRFVRVSMTSTALVAALIVTLGLLIYVVELPVVTPGTRRLFALFFVAIVPMYAFSAIVEMVQGPLQVTGRFLVPSVLRLGLPLGIIAGAVLFPQFSIYSVAIGGSIGGLLAIIGSGWLLRRDHILPWSGTEPLPDGVRRTAVTGFNALVLATFIAYANPMVDQWVAGFAGHGATSMLGYASRLASGIAGLLAAGVSQVLLIHYSRLAGERNAVGIQATFQLLIRVTPWLGCIATLGLWLTSDLVISLLYRHGQFTAADAHVVARLLDRYAMQFPLYWTGIASYTLIWALSMNQVMVRIGLGMFIANVAGDLLFMKLFGLSGIPISTSMVYVTSLLMLNLALRSAGAVRMPLRGWRVMLPPFMLLGICGVVIHQFGIRINIDQGLSTIVPAVSMVAAFAAVGAGMSLRAYREYLAASMPPPAQG